LRRVVFIFVLFRCSLLFAANTGVLQPFLPLHYSAKVIPFKESVTRDPAFSIEIPQSMPEVDQLGIEITEMEEILPKVKGARYQSTLAKLFKSLIIQNYALRDILYGKIYSTQSLKQVYQRIILTGKKIIKHGKKNLKIEKSKYRRQQIFYHIYVHSYFLYSNSERAIEQLKKMLSIKELNRAFKNRIYLLIGLHHIDNEDSNQSKYIKYLKKFAYSSNRESKIASLLGIAKGLAGLSSEGKFFLPPKLSYISYLKEVQRLVKRSPEPMKSRVLSFSLGVWREAMREKKSWQLVPFSLSYYNKMLPVQAIVERQALELWEKRKYNQSIKHLKLLSKKLKNNTIKIKLESRIVRMSRFFYKIKGDFLRAEREILDGRKKYRTGIYQTKPYQKIAQKLLLFLDQFHRELLLSEIRKTFKNPRKLKHIQILTKHYFKSSPNKRDYIIIATKLAQLYKKYKKLPMAIALYQELALKDERKEQKAIFYQKALKLQSVLAAWPSKPPWAGYKKINQGSRQKLLAFYEELNDLLHGHSTYWPYASHIGLLLTSIKRNEKAFEIWMSQLKKQSDTEDAQQAAGYMLFTFYKTKDWNRLEQMVLFCKKQNIIPLYKSQSLDLRNFYGKSLYHGGMHLYSKKAYKSVLNKLKIFVDNFQNSPVRSNAMYHLAISYYQEKQQSKAVRTLYRLVEQYSKFQNLKQALLLGSEWSLLMAREETTIFFLNHFIKKFKKSKEFNYVINRLLLLYKARGLYAEVLQVLRFRFQLHNKKHREQSGDLHEIMVIEDHYGDKQRALQTAKILLNYPGGTQEHRAKAIKVLADYAYREKNIPALKKLMKVVGKLNKGSLVVQESQGQILYYLTNLSVKKDFEEVQSIALADPMQSLIRTFILFTNRIKKYDNICYSGSSSYCILSIYKKLDMFHKIKPIIADITIVKSLTKDVVVRFMTKRKNILKQIDKAIQNLNLKAKRLLEAGRLTPALAKQIFWKIKVGNDFHLVDTEVKEGYLQWTWKNSQATEEVL